MKNMRSLFIVGAFLYSPLIHAMAALKSKQEQVAESLLRAPKGAFNPKEVLPLEPKQRVIFKPKADQVDPFIKKETNAGEILSIAYAPTGKCMAIAVKKRAVIYYENGKDGMKHGGTFLLNTGSGGMDQGSTNIGFSKMTISSDAQDLFGLGENNNGLVRRYTLEKFSTNEPYSPREEQRRHLIESEGSYAFADIKCFAPNSLLTAENASGQHGIIKIWEKKKRTAPAMGYDQMRARLNDLVLLARDLTEQEQALKSYYYNEVSEQSDYIYQSQKSFTVDDQKQAINAVDVSPNASMVIVGSSNADVTIWDINSGKLLATLKGHSKSVQSVAFAHTSNRGAVSGSDDGTAKIWDISDLNKPNVLHTLDHGGAKVISVAFSPQDDCVLTVASDGKARLWGAKTGELKHTFEHRPIQCAAFSPDGKEIAFGQEAAPDDADKDQDVAIWTLFNK